MDHDSMTEFGEFVPYFGEFEFASDSQWGDVVLMLSAMRGASSILRDAEAIRCHETGYSPCDIRLGTRQYTDDQLGKLDGPGRYIRKPDPKHIKAITAKGGMTKRQRSKLRKQRRAAKRKGEAFNESEMITLIVTS